MFRLVDFQMLNRDFLRFIFFIWQKCGTKARGLIGAGLAEAPDQVRGVTVIYSVPRMAIGVGTHFLWKRFRPPVERGAFDVTA